ncbi:MAG: ATP-binding protein [Phycisphaerales bacterium]
MRKGLNILHWRPSLRLRLTLWMMLIFLVVQMSLILVLQLYQRRSIQEFFDGRLLKRHSLILDEVRAVLPAISDEKIQDIAEMHRRLIQQRQFLINVYDSDGNPVAFSRQPRERLPQEVWNTIRDWRTAQVIRDPGPALRLVDVDGASAAAGWMTAADGTRYLVVAAWTDMYAVQMLHLLSGAVFIMIPIGLVSLMISAYAISGIAEEPIRAVRLLARGLDPEFLGTVVPSPPGGPEVKDLQRDLERTRTKLETAFSAQERFMSNVSHELKTPISVMLTEAQALRLSDAPRDVRAFVASTIEELDKLGRMVESFLLLTRVRHGKAAIPNQELCSVRDIITASYEGCAAMALQHRVRVGVTLPEGDGEDAVVLGNADLLRTVIDNLLRNAIRFSPAGFMVEVVGSVRDDRAHIGVRDFGPGIPAELLPRIFDRFSQSTEEQRRGRGHGLGLEIAMGITELHGGTISVRNVQTGGCEFEVVLPLYRESPVRV